MFVSGPSNLYSEDDIPLVVSSRAEDSRPVETPPLMMNAPLLTAKIESLEKEVRAQSARISALEAKVVETLSVVQQMHQMLKTLVVVSQADGNSGFKTSDRSPPKMSSK